MLDIVFISILAWVYVEILTRPTMLLGWFKAWANRVIKKEWILNPLVNCEYCIVGQWALWYYLIRYWYDYNIIDHIFFIGSGIFLVEVYNKLLHNKWH